MGFGLSCCTFQFTKKLNTPSGNISTLYYNVNAQKGLIFPDIRLLVLLRKLTTPSGNISTLYSNFNPQKVLIFPDMKGFQFY